jgi:Orange carotenoid protein, N-terminal
MFHYVNKRVNNTKETQMAYATSSNTGLFSSFTLSAIGPTEVVPKLTAQFKSLSVDEQLALLWFIYTEMGRSITPAATGAARLHLVEGILEQIQQMPYEEQLQVMRDLAQKNNTPISRAYGALSVNTKLAFWYRLSEWMDAGSVVPVPSWYKLSPAAIQLLAALQLSEFSQQITVLRNAVVDMGVDPLG